jgi:hypothetical protein
MSELDEMYQEVCRASSPLNKHCSKIHEIASKCHHITELAIKTYEIAISVLATKPTKFHLYREKEETLKEIKKKIEDVIPKHTEIKLFHGHSLKTQIEATDMLILNTHHTAARLKKELLQHAGNVKRFIAFPSVYAFAKRGEDGSIPGVVDAILEFIKENPEWFIIYKNKASSGLIIIEREPPTGSDFDKIYSMVSFDIPEVKWVERYVVGLSHPKKDWTGDEVEAMAVRQMTRLNTALRYGMIMGVERNFTEINMDGKSVLTGYLVYHVGFKTRPTGY